MIRVTSWNGEYVKYRHGDVAEWERFEWWPGAESNCRHADFQSAALPTELPGHIEPHDKNREEAEL